LIKKGGERRRGREKERGEEVKTPVKHPEDSREIGPRPGPHSDGMIAREKEKKNTG
jgi:hypothetical protein